MHRNIGQICEKTISKTNNGLHYETWDCWGDFWCSTQDINKLFKTGEFKKEYGECELGPKCPREIDRGSTKTED